MKKSIIALLLVAIIAAPSAFAMGGPITETIDLSTSLDLRTTVDGINAMKLTTAAYTPEVPSEAGFVNAAANEQTETVSIATDGTTLAYLSILTNNREGFSVEIEATELASSTEGNNYTIGYNLTCGNTEVEAGGSSKTITSDSIDRLSAFSYAVSVDLNDAEYNAALEDEYTANVSFAYTAK